VADPTQGPEERIREIDVADQMQQAYIDYAMSVITARALPDVRDGLLPVHRRILYAMHEAGNTPDRPFRKSAKTVGEVIGNYHPHGDVAVYSSLVRLAQDFSLRYPLVEGHGNFGCFTADTEVRLADGTARSFRQLAELGPEARFPVYAADGAGRPVVALGRNARRTRPRASLVRVVLDNGAHIRCTPDHRFLLRDGTYKQAGELTPEDLLLGAGPGGAVVLRPVGVTPLPEREDVYDLTVDGYHNFLLQAGVFVHNSIDGDPPAAMRYTEARLSRIAGELLRDLEKDTVDFQPNYDDTKQEPVVLPARFPNLLCNGSIGIAVGMSTNIPPHNLREVVEATIALIDRPEMTVAELARIVRGPDFPTGAIVLGREGILQAYETGRGTITVRGRAEITVARGERPQIVITEIPYETRKSAIIERIAQLYREKRLEGIAGVTDASDRHGMRLIVELQRGANAHVLLNQLYKETPLQQTYGIRLLALVRGRPRLMSLKEILQHYIQHQREVVLRRTRFDLERAERRAHVVQGLLVALDHLDEVIGLIRSSRTRAEASAGLQQQFGLSEVQAEAILDMRLVQLTGLERQRLEDELAELERTIARLRAILESEQELLRVIKEELREIAERYGDARRTQIVAAEATDFSAEDLVAEERVVVTLTRAGYIKRTPLDTYRHQGRGGRGVAALTTREDDFVTDVLVPSTHDYLLFFTTAGRVYRLRVYEIPEASRQARGTAVVNLLPLSEGERVAAVIPVGAEEFAQAAAEARASREDTDDDADAEPATAEAEEEAEEPGTAFLLISTRRGRVKRLRLSQLAGVRKGGLLAIGLEEGDELNEVRLCSGDDEVILVSRQGQAARFPAREVRPMGRTARGVTGMRLAPGDEVVGMGIVREGAHLLVVSENGLGKRTPLEEFPSHHRGSTGVRAQRLTERSGRVAGVRVVRPGEEVMLITAQGRLIRQKVDGIPVQSRGAQGVTVMRPEPGDGVVAVAALAAEEGDA
jgi:DNA gyrase subunit A